MARVGVFGGSFNPIHEGHVSFLKQVKAQLNLDYIIIVICKNAIHKHVNLVSKKHRFEMCKIATKGLNYVELSNLEFEIDKNGYSFYTLQKIKQQNLENELFLIVGPDSFLNIGRWHKFRQILTLARIVSGYSNEQEFCEMKQISAKFKFNAELLNVKLMNCHSTKVRIKLAQKLNCTSFLNSGVLEYILKNRLYSAKDALALECENACKNLVSNRRFNHCVLVGKMAQQLAKIYGQDESTAFLAGLLHDIVKERSEEELIKIFRLGGVDVNDLNEVERINPKLWHARAGAIYCKEVLGIENQTIMDAIACHTTGKKNMTDFEKIIFIADNTSVDRKSANAKIERKLARRSLNRALFFHLKNYIQLGCKKNMTMHINSIECYNQLVIAQNLVKQAKLKPNEHAADLVRSKAVEKSAVNLKG